MDHSVTCCKQLYTIPNFSSNFAVQSIAFYLISGCWINCLLWRRDFQTILEGILNFEMGKLSVVQMVVSFRKTQNFLEL